MRCEPGVLYECERPPVVEVVIGVAFAPIDGLDAVHVGSYWERVRQRFPTQSIVNPILPPVVPPRALDVDGQPVELRVDPTYRFWLTSADDVELIQVQSDRFLRNWRKKPTDTAYPRFSEVWRRFADSWAEYLVFLDEHRFGTPPVLQCEIGYVNKVAIGDKPLSWAMPPIAGFGEISPYLAATGRRALVTTALPDGLGTAQVEVQGNRDGSWRLSLNAKGQPAQGDVEGVGTWLDASRRWLNHLFVSSLGDDYAAELGVRVRS